MFKVSCIQLKSNNDFIYNLRKTEKLIQKAIKQAEEDKGDFLTFEESMKVVNKFNKDNNKLILLALSIKFRDSRKV